MIVILNKVKDLLCLNGKSAFGPLGLRMTTVGLALLLWCQLGVRPAGAIDTTITGERMELLNKGNRVLFTGGVQLNRGTDKILADRMTTNQKRDKVTAEGHVRLFRQVSSTETWEAKGQTGFYETGQGSGYLLGTEKVKVHVTRTEVMSSTSSRVIHIYADRIDFARLSQQATATGRVEGTTIDPQSGDHYDFWSPMAFFDGTNNLITLSGSPQPLVIQTFEAGRRMIQGDKIVYYQQTQRMVSEGNAQAVFEDKSEKGEKKK